MQWASDRAFAMAEQGQALLTDGSYQEVTAAVLGARAGRAMTWCLAGYLTVSNVAFLVIMFDQAQPVLRDKLGSDSALVDKKVLVPIFAWAIGATTWQFDPDRPTRFLPPTPLPQRRVAWSASRCPALVLIGVCLIGAPQTQRLSTAHPRVCLRC